MYRNGLYDENDSFGILSTRRLDAWIVYELEFFLWWIFSSIIFLFFIHTTKFLSIWQQNEQKMNLDSIWRMKDSTDALEYFEFEVEGFNLCMAFLMNSFYFIYKSVTEINLSFFDTMPCMLINCIRCLLLIGFIKHIGSINKEILGYPEKTFWTVYFSIILAMYTIYAIWFMFFNPLDHVDIDRGSLFGVIIHQTDLINMPILIGYFIILFHNAKNKKD